MLGQLLPCGGGEAIPLWGPTLLVGRSKECHLRLKSEHISAKHCLLDLRGSCWHVTDLQSKNGVKVAGRRTLSEDLKPNEVLSIGPFRFQIVYYPNGEEPGPTITNERDTDSGVKYEPHSGSFGELIPLAGGKPLQLISRRLTVGRSLRCDIPIDYDTISSKHCELWLDAGYWNVKDLDSRNGIRVDGKRCQESALRPGQVLSVARFRFRIAYVPKANRTNHAAAPSEKKPAQPSVTEVIQGPEET